MVETFRSIALTVLLLAASAGPQVVLALDWNVKTASHDDRFYTGTRTNVIGESQGFDWSGVGITQSPGQGLWATMISDTYFISAYHTGIGGSSSPVHFYGTNAIANGYDDYNSTTNETNLTIDSTFGQKIAGTDIWLGRLTSAPSSAIARYPLIQRDGTANYAGYLNTSIYVVGYADSFSDYNYFRLGTNNISSTGNLVLDNIHGTLTTTYNFIKDPGAGDDEVGFYSGGGDSSGPTFAKGPTGKLALTGIHLAIGTGSIDSDVSQYTSTIASAVATASGNAEHVTIMTDQLGDLNGDYKVDSSDFGIFSGNYPKSSGATYNQGDLNGDGVIDGADFSIFGGVYGSSKLAPTDFNHDAHVDRNDMIYIADHWHTSVTAHTSGDANGDGYVDGHDMDLLNATWKANWTPAYVSPAGPADINHDGLVDIEDYLALNDHWQYNCSTQACDGADINGDGFVNGSDFSILAGAWDQYGPADIDSNGKIDNADLNVLLNHWHQSTSNGKADGDINGDGYVDASDFELMADWWSRGMGDVSQQPAASTVPEPSCAALAIICLSVATTLPRNFRRYKLTATPRRSRRAGAISNCQRANLLTDFAAM